MEVLRRLPPTGRRAIDHPNNDLLAPRSRSRAARSMRCLPFGTTMYRTLQQQGLDAETLWKSRERFGRSLRWPTTSDGLEDELRWLITVGVLRREVDGQGLTSRFRLTPLGRQLLDEDSELLKERATLWDWLRHGLRRRWPF